MEKWAKKLNSKKDYVPVVYQQPRIEAPPQVPTKQDVVSDICFSLLEKKDRPTTLSAVTHVTYHSDSDEHEDQAALKSAAAASSFNENDLVDFEKLTCFLCKRAFQSVDILSKHIKQSNLHKENLQKYKLQNGILDIDSSSTGTCNLTALRFVFKNYVCIKILIQNYLAIAIVQKREDLSTEKLIHYHQ